MMGQNHPSSGRGLNIGSGILLGGLLLLGMGCTKEAASEVLGALEAPTITSHPKDQTVLLGQNATFSVMASGVQIQYQWYRNGIKTGSNANSLNLVNCQLSDHNGQFHVVVSNAGGSHQSSPAHLYVLASGAEPTIQQGPQSLTVSAGSQAEFRVSATGAQPLQYQWIKDGIPLGPISPLSSYLIPSTVASDAGHYSVKVINSFGRVNSNPATLSVSGGGAFDAWIDGAYLTQATQSFQGDVPLIRNRPAFLRVFLRANQANTAKASLRIRLEGGGINETLTLQAPSGSVPLQRNEGDLSTSWNAPIPASWIQPGLQLSVEADVTDANPANNKLTRTLDVRDPGTWKLSLVPILQANGALPAGDVTSANASTYTLWARKVLPIPENVDLTLRSPFTTSRTLGTDGTTGWSEVLSELQTARIMEGSSRHWFGVAKPNYNYGGTGLGYVGKPVALGVDWDYVPTGWNPTVRAGVLAHETGHNWGLGHAPCGISVDLDPAYPYSDGDIGLHGYDLLEGKAYVPGLDPPGHHSDLMAYCGYKWISDYHYKKMLQYRQSNPLLAPERAPGLLVWGRVTGDNWILEPALPVKWNQAPSQEILHLEHKADETPYQAEILDQKGRILSQGGLELLSLSSGSTERHFFVILPLGNRQEMEIHSLRIRQDGRILAQHSNKTPSANTPLPRPQKQISGCLRLVWGKNSYPLAILRSSRTGEVLGFFRDGWIERSANSEATEILLCDGLRTTGIPLEN